MYEGTGNEYGPLQCYERLYNKNGKVQQRIDNGGTVMANIVEIADGSN